MSLYNASNAQSISDNEMKFVLVVLKSPEMQYNANSISKVINISPMGALKIAKKLERQGILRSKVLGRTIFYSIKLDTSYVQKYLGFLLNREAEFASPYVKRWVNEVRKINNVHIAVLYGSVLSKHDEAKDIDLLLVSDNKRFNKLKKEVGEINKLNDKKLHPLYQSEKDLSNNIRKQDKVILNAIKGLVVSGEEKLINILTDKE